MDKKQICRIIFIGESEVGKTSLINSILGEQFNQEHITTIGIVNTLKEKIIKNKILLINLYDTAGQEKFRSLTKLTYNKKDIVIFVYDVTKIESYNAIKDYWIEEVKDNANDLKVIGIFGNKCDLFEMEIVDENEVIEYAKKINAIYSKVSALNGFGIDDAMDLIYNAFLDYIEKNPKVNDEILSKSIDSKSFVKKKKCC